MRKFLILLLFSMLFGLLEQAAYSKTQRPKLVTLTKKNTLVLRGVVSDESVAVLEIELMEMSAKLKPTEIIYLVLDTPGGSVEAGSALIDFVHGLPNKVKTISLFAASMGFHIAQSLDERLVLPSSTLMSHRASLSGLSGEIPGELLVQVNYLLRNLNRMDQIAAERMKLSRSTYQHMIRDQMWLKGEESVTMRAADRVILARCDSTFAGTTEILLGTFLGIPVMGTMSNCPLITGIMNVHFVPQEKSKEEADNTQEVKRMCEAYVSDKILFVKRYIVNGKLLFNLK